MKKATNKFNIKWISLYSKYNTKYCNESDYYDDFQSIKNNIDYTSNKRNLITHNNNNINLRKTTQTYIYYF